MTELPPQTTRTKHFVKFGLMVFEICEERDNRQTNKQTDINTLIATVHKSQSIPGAK